LLVRRHFGVAVALVAGLAFGSHPLFVTTMGWNYVDGFGLAYFLAAAALASALPGSRWPRATALLAGAAIAALVAANLVYVILVPLVVGELVLQRRRAGGGLTADLAWISAGAAAAATAMAGLSVAWGGHALFLAPSIDFVGSYLQLEENPWRRSDLLWLRTALWLVLPVVAAVGALVTLARLRRSPAGTERASTTWAQLQYLGLAALLQLSALVTGGAPLQKTYYTSLLLPSAFLALAGQLARLVPERRRLPPWWVLTALLALCVAPYLVRHVHRPPLLFPEQPLLLPLAAGLAAIALIALAPARRAALVAVFLLLAVLSREVRRVNAEPGALATHRQLDAAARLIAARGEGTWIWLDRDEPAGAVLDALAAVFLFADLINEGLPETHGGRVVDGREIEGGDTVLVLSSVPGTPARGAAALAALGLTSIVAGQQVVAGEPPLLVTELRLYAAEERSRFVDFRGGAPHTAVIDGFYPLEGSFRWLGVAGTVQLAGLGSRLEIVAATAVPWLEQGLGVAAVPLRILAVSATGGAADPIGRVVVDSDAAKQYLLEVPPHLVGERPVNLRLEADLTWRPVDLGVGSGDVRELSAMIFAVGSPEPAP
jgi:hypothetical protein